MPALMRPRILLLCLSTALLVAAAAQERPVLCSEMLLCTIGAQNLRRVALGVEAHEEKIDLVPKRRRQRLLDALEIVNEDRAGVFAGGKEHRQHLRAPAEDAELHFTPDIGGPRGVELVD